MCVEKGEKKRNSSVTETEKSRYRDEFLIRYSREVYIHIKPLSCQRTAQNLSRLLVAKSFLFFFL